MVVLEQRVHAALEPALLGRQDLCALVRERVLHGDQLAEWIALELELVGVHEPRVEIVDHVGRVGEPVVALLGDRGVVCGPRLPHVLEPAQGSVESDHRPLEPDFPGIGATNEPHVG